MACTPPSNASIPRRADATLVAFESFTYSTPPLRATSSRRCGTPAKSRSAARHGLGGHARGESGGGRAHCVLQVVRSAQADVGGRQRQLLRIAERHAPRASRQVKAGRRDRHLVGRLAPEHAELGLAVGREGAVTVEVVLLEVQQQRRRRGRTPACPRPGSSRPRRSRSRRAPPPPRAPTAACPRCRPPPPASPAARQIAPSSSTVVVLPFVPVTATKRLGSSRHASSSSPSTGTPALARRRDHAAPPAARPGSSPPPRALEQAHAVALELRLEVVRHLGPPGVQRRAPRRARAASRPRRRAPSARAPPPGTGPLGGSGGPRLIGTLRSTAGTA